MASNESGLTEAELEQIERANDADAPVVVFVHGLWLLASSWDRWRDYFEGRGYATIAPGWPDDPETVEEGRAHPDRFAGKGVGEITDHYVEAIGRLTRKPAVVGHSFGGLIAARLAGMGLASATVPIDPAPFRGVLPLPVSSLRSSSPVLMNPANRTRAVMLTYEQFRYAFVNAVDEAQARRLYDTYPVPGAARPLFQAAFANVNPRTVVKVDTRNPARGPMKILCGELDHTVPWAVANASYKRQKDNPGVTGIQKVSGRGHSLVFDDGWADVAEITAAFTDAYSG
jgi:non-heme chloroperoxidase